MKLQFKTTVRSVERNDNLLILKCGDPDEEDNFKIVMRMDAKSYEEFMKESDWPDPKDFLKIDITLEQVS
jgi:hypothetical protein